MTWRYQLTRETLHGEVVYAVREVYVSPTGKSWTQEPIRIEEGSREAVLETLMRIRTDVKRGGVLDIPCHQCSGQVRETVGLVCQRCGIDYGGETVASECNRCYEASTSPLWVAQFVTRNRADKPCQRHRALAGKEKNDADD